MPALWYCNDVSLAVGRIYLLFNGNGGVVVLVLSVFGIFYLVDSDDGVA